MSHRFQKLFRMVPGDVAKRRYSIRKKTHYLFIEHRCVEGSSNNGSSDVAFKALHRHVIIKFAQNS